jgi:hypothetical protein
MGVTQRNHTRSRTVFVLRAGGGVVRVFFHLGPADLLRRLRDETWSTKRFYRLTCDLQAPLPPVRSAKVTTRMEPVDPTTFRGFRDELHRSSSANFVKVLLRVLYCSARLTTLYVSTSDNDPTYAQWLVTPEEQKRIPRFLPGRYPELEDGELLLEGAYTFERFRGLGLMGDGMGQLVRFARDARGRTLVTYVAENNVPSLRGCARVGFAPDAIRVSVRRGVFRRTAMRPLDPAAKATWDAAVTR